MHPILNEKKRGMALRFCSLWASGTKLSYSLHVENTKHAKNWLHFFFTWMFLYHKEVTRVFSSTSNIAWQFSYQWNWQRAISPQTQIHMYANLVEQNLKLTLPWSLCLYFFKSCFLLDAVSEKYRTLYFACDLALNFRVAKNFFNNFFVTWAQKEFAYLL